MTQNHQPASPPTATSKRGKNIVLLSDGTGNSASKPFKTNVWRTYQSLDLEPPNGGAPLQVAFYRDGVGTETFKPIALLGGAFGLGVMKDVRALYVFLCRNFRPGDRIYAFGFSRGAFTIRLLVGLVALCGLVQASDENQLFHFSHAAYKAFRRDFLRRTKHNLVAWIYRRLSPAPKYIIEDREKRIVLSCKALGVPQIPVVYPDIDFLGLWDTVDAYGMPIDELKQGIDRYIWPMSLADRRLSGIVRHACHALSLDDERPTFRPLLWDESSIADQARIEQVWFAGVHANVGGGYPIDDLSYVPLVWMLDHAAAAGLRLDADQVAFFRHNQNPHGTMYDSRSGIAGYYRYGPRSLAKLCHEKGRVRVAKVTIHPSVADRIARRQRAYAPISIPDNVALRRPGLDETVEQNGAFLNLAWDAVFWRRITYFTTVFLTAILVLWPLVRHAPAGTSDACWKAVPETCHGLLGWIFGALGKLLGLAPGWSHFWVDVFQADKVLTLPLIAAAGWLFFVQSGRLQRWIGERAEWGWAELKGNASPPAPHQTCGDRAVRKLRLSHAANAFAKGYEVAIGHVFGLGLLALIADLFWELVLLAVHHLPFQWPSLSLGLAFLATLGTFLWNARFRAKIAARLRAEPEFPTEDPEHQLCGYDARFLESFKAKASRLTDQDGRSLLALYRGPVLLPNDLVFAICFGALIYLLSEALASAYPAAAGWWHLSAALGLVYAAFDAAEDIALHRVFGAPNVRPGAAAVASWLRRAKVLSLTCSGTGGLLFLILSVAARFVPPSR